jgi:hypothetical protein
MILFREYVKSLKNINYIDYQELLPEFSSLTTDLLHPSDYGQLLIALGLKRYIH